MRTKHLINLLADVEVAKSSVSSAIHNSYGVNDEECHKQVLIAAQLECLANHLNNSIQVQNRSFLVNPEDAEAIVKSLNKKGFAFKIPVGDSVHDLIVQVLCADLEGSQKFAADFVYHMIHKGYEQDLSHAEIQALNSALALIEDKLDL